MSGYKPIEADSRVSAGLGRDGMFSYQIDGKDVTDSDGFGAAVGHDGIGKKIFEGTRTAFGGVGPGKNKPGKYLWNPTTRKVEKV